MIDNLRKEHFRLGEQTTQYARANAAYGMGTKSASKREILPWASMKTNYELGTDKDPKMTDNQNRFAQTQNAFRNGPSGSLQASPGD